MCPWVDDSVGLAVQEDSPVFWVAKASRLQIVQGLKYLATSTEQLVWVPGSYSLRSRFTLLNHLFRPSCSGTVLLALSSLYFRHVRLTLLQITQLYVFVTRSIWPFPTTFFKHPYVKVRELPSLSPLFFDILHHGSRSSKLVSLLSTHDAVN